MSLSLADHATTPTLLSSQDQTGFELGWDHAYRSTPLPARYLNEPGSLRAGWLAGRAALGSRTLPATQAVRMWLQLRVLAWLSGRSVELVQVTPFYLQQLAAGHCPIMRTAFNDDSVFTGDALFGRVRDDAGYAAGNLALLSAKANYAKGNHGWREAQQVARRLEGGAQSGIAGLNAIQWSRLAVICSFVESIPHHQTCELPLLVLPPNRLRLFNPAQALQAFVSRQVLAPGWSLRISRIEALVPGQTARVAFQTFFHALLPRVLEAGRNISAHELRWAIEDAWRHPLVLQRWTAFARQLSAAQCEALVLRAHAKRLGHGALHEFGDANATDGWNLESRGFVVADRRVPGPRGASPQRRRQSAPSAPLPAGQIPLHLHGGGHAFASVFG